METRKKMDDVILMGGGEEVFAMFRPVTGADMVTVGPANLDQIAEEIAEKSDFILGKGGRRA
ncbi:hypothetical protein FUAX_56040 (plasmid) [Fulvitalea axinellae]|uniref:Uncharacterized protein n=1 Tax=Fulvitalea axinellae TaxID=1182444 RepID=A0AAU9D220_9BACT|nr:hypothetical protein FUAX_56040 [Fulvitalea axinellae]